MLSSNSSSCNYQNPNYTLFTENDIASFTPSKSDTNNFFFAFPNSPPHFNYDDDVYLQFLDHVDLDSVTDVDWNNDKMNAPICSNISSGKGSGNPNPAAGAGAGEEQLQRRAPAAVRGRTMRKDRHSKINTARGPRDRRMRLSLDIARKFFDLQDLLRYDKASRTVDWLLRNSASAIRELVRGRDGVLDRSSLIVTESCTSEDCGEAVTSSSATEVKITAAAAATASRSGRRGIRGGGGGGGVIQQIKRATVGKESRNKARDRARERTSQKRRLMREKGTIPDAAGTVLDAAGTTTTHNFPLIYDALGSDEARITGGAAQGLLCQFNFHETSNQFLHLQGEQIAGINQFNDKTWEAYNSLN